VKHPSRDDGIDASISGFFPRILRSGRRAYVAAGDEKHQQYTRLVTVCGGMVLLNSIFNPLRPVNGSIPR